MRPLITLCLLVALAPGCATEPEYRSPYEGALTVPNGPGSSLDRLSKDAERRRQSGDDGTPRRK